MGEEGERYRSCKEGQNFRFGLYNVWSGGVGIMSLLIRFDWDGYTRESDVVLLDFFASRHTRIIPAPRIICCFSARAPVPLFHWFSPLPLPHGPSTKGVCVSQLEF